MSRHNLQEPLQPLPPMLNHIIRESIRKHLSWKWWDCDACGLALKDVAEVLEVGVASANLGLGDVEEGHVGATFDFVGCVLRDAGFGRVGYWVFDLGRVVSKCGFR